MRKTLRIVTIVVVVLAVAGYTGARLGSYFGSRGTIERGADDEETQKQAEESMRRQILQKQEDAYHRMKESGAPDHFLRRMARRNAEVWLEHGDEATAQKWQELAK